VNRHSAQTKLLSFFVLAFICLNAGAAVCVAYCRTSDGASPNSAVGTPAHHCEKAQKDIEQSGPAITAPRELRPCPMAVSFIAGPIEKHTLPIYKSEAMATPAIPRSIFADPIFTTAAVPVTYHGPPPLDRRPDRIKQRVLLI